MRLSAIALAVSLSLVTLSAARETDAAVRKAVTIPPQPLELALKALASERDFQIMFRSDLVRSQHTAGVAGELTVEEALVRLLEGTGLTYRRLDDHTVTIVPLAAAPDRRTEELEGRSQNFAREMQLSQLVAGATEAQSRAESRTGNAQAGGESTDAGGIDEIVVRGLKRLQSVGKIDAPVLETPQSISIISGARIEATMSQTVMDVLQYTAGVRANAYLDTRRDDFSIRGFQESGRSGVFRDGLRLPALTLYGFWEMDPYGLERVEVMRGPASVLYGQSSPGGVVNLVTKRPTEAPMHEVGLVLGSHDRIQGVMDFGGPIRADGSLLYRFTALGRDAETQVDHTQDRRVYVAPAFAWNPSERLSLTVLSTFQKSWNTASPQFLPFEGTVLPNPNGDIPFDRYTGEPGFDRFDKTQSSVGYLLEYKLGDSTAFLQNARYGRLELDYDVVYSFGLHLDDMATIDRYSLTDAEAMDSFSVDNQIQTRWTAGGFDHHILIGADFQRATGTVKRGTGVVGTFDLFDPVYGADVTRPAFSQVTDRKSRQVGLYLQDHLKIGAHLVVHAALRHDWARSEIVNVLTGAPTSDLDDAATTYQLGVAYPFENGVAPYASYSTSFSPLSGVDINGKPFVPEKGKQVEAGFKFDLRPFRTFLTLAAFDLRKQNVPTAATRDDPFGPEIQTGEIRSRGVELEFNANPIRGLSLLGSLTKNDNEVTRSNLVGMAGEVGSIPDYHASRLASLWASYTLQGGSLAGLDVGLGLRYVGSVEVAYPAGVAPFTVPSYELLDAAVSYERKGYRLALNLNNVTDREYVGACDAYSCYYGIGRTLFGSVKYKW